MSTARVVVEAAGAAGGTVAAGEHGPSVALVDMTTGAEIAEPSEVGQGGVLLAVADGAGGAVGAVASATALNLLRQRLAAADEEPLPGRLARAVDATSFAIWHVSGVSGRTGMATSLVAVVLDGGDAWVAWVGDSRAYVSRGGALARITDDHAAAPGDGASRGEVLQSVGGAASVRVAVRRLALRRGDEIALCSGALSDALPAEELRDLLARAASSREACELIVDAAARRRSTGAVTALVARCDGEGLPEPAPGERPEDTLVSVQEFAPPAPGDPIASDAPTPRVGLPPLPEGATES